eukprot:GEZU01013515.1.p1 GENE.GEZU01013515.1~~GEZU01013515.1.p1  ORF type:complete len:559 (+),score=200.74 GEZU01013515.1:81-1757(+)
MTAQKDVQFYSPLQKERLNYNPPLPPIFQHEDIELTHGEVAKAASDDPRIKTSFPSIFNDRTIRLVPSSKPINRTPMKVGVVLSGGQAPGGHNVITGIFDYLHRNNPENKLYGFLGGPKGIFTGKYTELTTESVFPYRNQGGFDIIGSGRDKIETPEQFSQSMEWCKKLDLDGLVVIGGDDSNTNAALLAEHFAQNGVKTKVIGVPKTIDGDLKGPYIETSFGFDTACKVYSELIGNIAVDSNSSKKYYHFIRLMGRAASHITLECALATHPNFAFIGEEVAAKHKSLSVIVNELCDVIMKRAELGKSFGVVLIPEGLIDFIPEIHHLISELNDILANIGDSDGAKSEDFIVSKLSQESATVFKYLPADVRGQLLLDRDSHGNVQLSKIETEKLIISLVDTELKRRNYRGSFQALAHFLGYEGRCSLPSVFDCDYCYALGYTAASLIRLGATGVMSCVRNLAKPVSEWEAGGVPITTMIQMERRKGKDKPVIRKALVELDSQDFKEFVSMRDKWAITDSYSNPGPIQFYGKGAQIKSHILNLTTQQQQQQSVRQSVIG